MRLRTPPLSIAWMTCACQVGSIGSVDPSPPDAMAPSDGSMIQLDAPSPIPDRQDAGTGDSHVDGSTFDSSLRGPRVADCPEIVEAIPSGRGFGATGPIARGGGVYRVTTLAANGVGSLAQAFDDIEGAGGGVIVFEVAGVIDLEESLDFGRIVTTASDVWVAGQTAPAPGIYLRGGLAMRGRNILLQHFGVFRRHRVGDVDGIGFEPSDDEAGRVLLDHMAVWCANDGNIDFANYDGGQVTVQNSILATPLKSGNEGPNHNYNTLSYGAGSATWHGNLFTTARDRQPESGFVNLVFVNNVIFNREEDGRFMFLRNDSGPSRNSIVNNIFWEYRDCRVLPIDLSRAVDDETSIYASGNRWRRFDGTSITPEDQFAQLVSRNGSDPVNATRPPVWNACMEPTSTDELISHLQAHVGPRPRERIDYLAGLVDEVGAPVEPARGFPETCAEAGGDLLGSDEFDSPASRTFETPDDPHEIGPDGYTNLERYLFRLAAELE